MSGDWFDRLGQNPHLLAPHLRRNPVGGQVMALLAERRVTERLPPPELARRQAVALFELARHAAAYSPHFAGRLTAAGLTPATLGEPGGLARLAPLTRRDLAGAGESLFCQAYPQNHGGVTSASTSGSTGEPVTVRRTGLCELQWQADTLREHLWHGRDFSGRLAAVRATIPKRMDIPDWGPPCNLLFHTGSWSGMPASSSTEELCRWLLAFDPDYLLALPTSLAGIIAQFDGAGERPGRLRGVRTLGETVRPRLCAEARRVLGAGIDDIYSSQECGIMATQCPEEGSYHVSEMILLEVVDAAGRPCGAGEAGRILITDLANYVTPLIRYEIGDYAEIGAPCACGRGLPAIRRVLGRERNLVLLPDGTRHWPLVGFHRWGDAYPVRQFQFVQLDRETVLAKMSAAGRPDAEQEARLTTIIQEELRHPFAIRYEWHETPLPRGPGGKFEEFLCRAE